MAKVRTQVPALAALVDFWWQGVHQDLEPFRLAPRWQQWVHESLLPLGYWATQVPRTRCHRRKAKMPEALEAVRAAFEQHPITQRLAPPTSWRSGRRGRPTGSKLFSAPPRPLKAAPAFCRNCITISGAYPGGDTRCGRSYIISMVEQQMVQRQRRGFSGGRFRICLRRCYPISKSCRGRDNEKRRERYVTDIMECPALSGFTTGHWG